MKKGDLISIEKALAIKRELIMSKGEGGWMPLHYSSQIGREDIVESLLRKFSANVDQRNHGKTALMIACLYSHKRVIERLLLAGANANLQCELTGNTAMHYLAEASRLKDVKELIQLMLPFSKMSLSLQNYEGLFPCDLAVNQLIKQMLKHTVMNEPKNGS
jgi:ankyrin repeat protein